MTRRTGRRNARIRISGSRVDPFASFAADLAWRASDAVDNGSVTTSLPPYMGALTLAANGTGQPIKAASANFVGRQTVAFNGLAASRGYSGVLGGAPTGLTVASIVRITVGQSAAYSLTVGGTVNTGSAAGYDVTQAFAKKLTTNALLAKTLPLMAVVLATVDAAGVSLYCNALTAVTAAAASALAGTTFAIGTLSSAGVYTLTGEWLTTGAWLRAFTDAEAKVLIRNLGRYYGIPITS